MASPEVLDFEKLLAPISDDAPAGLDLRTDDAARMAYYEIKRLRDSARKAEDNLFDEEASPSDAQDEWRQVYALCEETLATRAKDLQVVAWMIEALVRLKSFAGLRDGFRLVRELAEQYWDGIHPRPDDEGVLDTVAPLAGLNGEDSDGPLIAAIGKVAVTEAGSYEAFPLWRYRQAHDLERVPPDKKEQRLSDGWVSLSMFNTAVAETSPDFFRTILDDLAECQQELALLGTVLDEKCGKSEDGYELAPPSSRIREALTDTARTVQGIAKDIVGVAVEETEEASAAEDGDAPATATAKKGVHSREDAFKALTEVADFFRRTEPHSPISYALEQVVRWGRMSLPDLLSELITDSSSRDAIFRQVGIGKKSNDDD